MKILTKKHYKKALWVVTSMLNGETVYGIDKRILQYQLTKQNEICTSMMMQNFIVSNLDRFSENAETRKKAIERLGF